MADFIRPLPMRLDYNRLEKSYKSNININYNSDIYFKFLLTSMIARWYSETFQLLFAHVIVLY